MTVYPPKGLLIDDDRRLQVLGIPDDVAAPLREYVHALNVRQAESAQRFPHLIQGWYDTAPDQRPDVPAGTLAEWFDLDPAHKGGGRYIRVVALEPADAHRARARQVPVGTPVPSSVHSFVEKTTGDVYKPAGYKAPAKGVRYRLTDDDSRADMLRRMDVYGGYLYAR